MTAQDQVREFHQVFGAHIENFPTVPPEDIRAVRARLLVEECAEVVAEILAGHPDRSQLTAEMCDQFADRSFPIDRMADPAKVARELADLVYVAAGAAVNWGVPLDAAVTEVHRSNMAKLGPDGKPILRADGKVLKPPGWTPPDVAGVLGRAS